MGEVLLLLVVALTVAAVVFGVTVLVTGRDPGLSPAEPDGHAVPLPGARPLRESDVGGVRFDTALRGYRMAQVDQAMRRAAYDIGYKAELIGVLEAEVNALREGRTADADALREARARSAGAVAPDNPDATAEAVPAGAASVPNGTTDAASPIPAAATDAVPTTGALLTDDADTAREDSSTPTGGTDTAPGADAPPLRLGTAPTDTTSPERDEVTTGGDDSTDPVDGATRRGPAVRSESA
ncbi:DivIVA domain-containing protein [Micromonospora endolithica]|uniref:DivIVA domain-containing protein n=1 Tax=Micromonospora endolithica TaxID=230091 RepID=UPI0011AD34FB|nr:DivIVA domain-containing protein [Micromonospora endolithica]TWJ24197.1 DivIVA domain-containing protein [Micromonospora endolithica]